MPKLPLRLICPLVIALAASPVSADITPDTAAGKPRRASLIKRFFREFDNYDTTYVAPNRYNFTAMAQVSTSTQSCRLAGYPPDGHSQSLSMSPRSSVKLGPYFGWRWLFFGYTFDVGRVGSNQTRREFNLSLYSAMLGCDFIYVRNNGGYRLKRVTGFDGIDEKAYAKRDFDGLETTTLGVNAYYIFNHRRFSYPAAFSQSTVQRRSAGSWKVGIQYCRHTLRFSPEMLPQPLQSGLIDQLRISEVRYNDYSLNVGYAYNWVFAPINFDVITRAGLVWNNGKWFAGSSLVSHIYAYRKRTFSLTNTLMYGNIYAGFYFHKKKRH